MKTQKINGTVTILKRLNNSVNGNPRFKLMIDDTVIITKSDYGYCYDIENLARSGEAVEAEIYYTKAGARRLETIKRVKNGAQ